MPQPYRDVIFNFRVVFVLTLRGPSPTAEARTINETRKKVTASFFAMLKCPLQLHGYTGIIQSVVCPIQARAFIASAESN